jgi:hypothetical protein
MSSAPWLFSRVDGASSAVSVPGVLSSNAPRIIAFRSAPYRTQIESCMMEHGCVIESLGTFPKRRNCSSNVRRVWRHERSCTKLRHIDAAQFCAMLSTPSMTRLRGEGELAERSAAESQPRPASPVIVETWREPLKFVVNPRLPVDHSGGSITSMSRAGGMRFAPARVVQRGLELRGGTLPGVRHHSNLETRKGD